MYLPEVKVCALIIAIFCLRIFGLMMIVPVVPVSIDSIGGAGAFSAGLVIGAYGITQAILQLPLGYLSDIYGRKKIIFIGLLLLLIGSLIGYFAKTVEVMVLARVVQGSGAIGSTLLASIADNTSERNRTIAMAVCGASIAMSFFLSVILGPVVASNFGFKTIFLLIAFLSFVALCLLCLLPAQNKTNMDSVGVIDQIVTLLKNTNIIRMDFSILMLHFVYTSVFVLVPVMLLQQYSLDLGSHSSFYIACLLGSLFISVPFIIYAEKFRITKGVMFISILSFLLVFMFLTYPTSSVYSFGIVVTLFFAGFTFLESILPSMTSKIAPENARGITMALFSCCQFLGIFLGGMITGLLQHYFGSFILLVVVSVALFVWILIIRGFDGLHAR